MNSDRDQLAKEIFADALEKADAAERAAYLTQACGEDAQLRQHVEALLQAHQKAGAFLEEPAPPPPGKETVVLPPEESQGTLIGRYKILEKIGEGGFGVVYMAQQQEPVKRRVALKVIKAGMDTRQVLARFEAERQALALMDHPNIAKVLDAGATETGRPFFVMELVRGVKITDYCDDPQNSLSTEQRLTLFIQVCSAVKHAHQKGIIHRDIKPSNILVTLQEDGTPTPKIIDFGIAKATTGQTLTDKTLVTAFEQFIGTPAYMSPEQAQMTAIDVDIRSDIYSLGVLLYELLTDKTPFDSKRLLAGGLQEIRRIIREEEPPRPSTRLSALSDEERTTVAKRRRSDPPKLIRFIRGDLDWIVMKCLEKDRTRRYETANDLILDLQRHLRDQPITASPPSFLYRSRKWIKRRSKEVSYAVFLFAFLVSGLGFVLERHRAENLRVARILAIARQEESDMLSRVIAGLSLSEKDKERTGTCVARLAARVKSGTGSDSDHELLSRFLSRNVHLSGRSIQTLSSQIFLWFSAPSDFPVEGLGIVLLPSVSVDGASIEVPEGSTVYQSGAARNVGTGIPLRFQPAARNPGACEFLVALEAQLVHDPGIPTEGGDWGVKSKQPHHGSYSTGGGRITGWSDARLSDFRLVGSPVHIVMPVVNRMFVAQLPADYPTEVLDEAQAKKITDGLNVSGGRLLVREPNQCAVEFTITLPLIERALPVALRVDLVQFNDIPLRGWVKSLFYESNCVSSQDGEGIQSLGGGCGGNGDFRLNFILPGIQPAQIQSTASLQIAIRSAREAALKNDHIEYFLRLPEVRKTVSFTRPP